MTGSSEDLARLMSNVNLTGPTHVSASDECEKREKALDNAIWRLVAVSSTLSTEAKQVPISRRVDDDTILSRRVAVTGALLKRSAEITKIADDLMDDTVDHVVAGLVSLHDDDQTVRKLLLHFEDELRGVVKGTYKDVAGDEYAMVRILEACHGQALSGQLHVNNFFAPRYEACLGSPYDPDFESEAYYEHENRLLVDDEYARAERMCEEQKSEERGNNEARTHRAWIRHWVRMLHICAGGPTLFWPYVSGDMSKDLPDVPRYLFRTFDASSSGKSDDTVVASAASVHPEQSSRTDLLSLQPEIRAERLCAHLNKDCFGTPDVADNLMSWTSSLLFAIQYAIWRCSNRRKSPVNDKIQVCVVDTTKFPRGQFVRDKWLLEQCPGSHTPRSQVGNLLRLRNGGYDNGEYLSQGLVVHRGRSHVVTLDQLIQSGLYMLYPELDDPLGKKKWTNRVRYLRTIWADSEPSSHGELRIASHIVKSCFRDFQPLEMAIYLLAFKNRQMKKASHTDTQDSMPRSYNDEPVETQRSMQAISASSSGGAIHFSSGTLVQELVLEELKSIFIHTLPID